MLKLPSRSLKKEPTQSEQSLTEIEDDEAGVDERVNQKEYEVLLQHQLKLRDELYSLFTCFDALKQPSSSEYIQRQIYNLSQLIYDLDKSLFELYAKNVKSTDNADEIPVSDWEWEQAEAFFTQYPAHLKFNKIHTGLHSFVKIDGCIYAIKSRHDYSEQAPYKTSTKGAGIDCIGVGTSAKVKLAKNRDNEIFALRIEGTDNTSNQVNLRVKEKQVLQRLNIDFGDAYIPYQKEKEHTIDSPYVKRIQKEQSIQLIPRKYKRYQILPLVEGQEYYDYLNKLPPGEESKKHEQQILITLIKSLRAISHLHTRGALHRDIKPENLMVDKEFNISLIDYAFCTLVPVGQQQTNPVIESVGSPEYVASEIMKLVKEAAQAKKKDQTFIYSFKTDLFAIGKMINMMMECKILTKNPDYEMLVQKITHDDNAERLEALSIEEALIKVLEKLEGLEEAALGLIKSWRDNQPLRELIDILKKDYQKKHEGNIYFNIENNEIVSYNLNEQQAQFLKKSLSCLGSEIEEGNLIFGIEPEVGRFALKLPNHLVNVALDKFKVQNTGSPEQAKTSDSSPEYQLPNSSSTYTQVYSSQKRKDKPQATSKEKEATTEKKQKTRNIM